MVDSVQSCFCDERLSAAGEKDRREDREGR